MAAIERSEAAGNDEARYCLERMDALAEEIGAAIHAIAGNTLPALEASVECQGKKVASLHLAIARLREVAGAQPFSVSPPWKARLQKSAHVLNGLNEQYAALIEHSGNSARLLQALHGSHAGRQGKTQEFGTWNLLGKTDSWEG